MRDDRSVQPPAADDLAPVAGGGILHRRVFMQRGLVLASALAGGSAAAADGQPPWMRTPGAPLSNYGHPSPFERSVIRLVGANKSVAGNGVSWTPLEDLEGTITPAGLHFERHHNGVPQIDPAQHRLLIHGLVRRPLAFGVPQLLRYPMASRQLFIECGGNTLRRTPTRSSARSVPSTASCRAASGPVCRCPCCLTRPASIPRRAGW